MIERLPGDNGQSQRWTAASTATLPDVRVAASGSSGSQPADHYARPLNNARPGIARPERRDARACLVPAGATPGITPEPGGGHDTRRAYEVMVTGTPELMWRPSQAMSAVARRKQP